MYWQCQHMQWKLLGWLLMLLHAACFNNVDIPWILQKLLFPHTSFWRESFLNISNHWPKSWPTAHLHISLFDLVNPLISADSCHGWHNYSLWGLLFQFNGQLALKFHWIKICFFLACIDSINIGNCYIISRSVMPKPVYLLTVQVAHKEYNSLTNLTWAKYEQLDSGEFEAVATPAFNAEACELPNLLACVSQLCERLNLPTLKELYRPMFFKHWRCLSDLNYRQTVLVKVWRMQLI